ncbi:hypothetical protein BC455_17645 [Vibrio harveyi]|nr:hypothetical protein BC455_17645 [Vibrio harveyi]
MSIDKLVERHYFFTSNLKIVFIKPAFQAGFLLSKLFIFHRLKHLSNKAFKSDSQRLAFFILSLSAGFTVVWLGFVDALLTP